MNWRSNRAAPAHSKRTMVAVAGLSVAGAAAVVAWYLVSGFPAVIYDVALLAGFLLAIGSVAAFLGSRSIAAPAAVATANDGIHFWYTSPYDQRSQTPTISWTQLNILGMQGPALGDPAARLIKMFRIGPDNARDIVSEWQRHRIASSTPPRPVPSVPRPPPALVPPPTPPGTVLVFRSGAIGRKGRGVACARCRVAFPGVERLRLIWCKVDRFYVCRKCWEDGCQSGHGKGVRARSKPARIATAVVVAALFFALWYPGIAYDYTLTNVWSSASISPVSTLRAGEVAKVVGTITRSASIAIGGYEVSSKYGWDWQWDTNDVFTIVDASGSINVSTAEWYVYYNGPFPAPNAYHIEVGDYISGDTIQIVGTVVQAPGGGLELLAQVLAQASAVPLITLAPSPDSAMLMWLLPLVVFGILAAGAAFFVQRRLAHRRATRGQPSYSIRDTNEARDARLGWQPNGKGTSPRRRTTWALVAAVGGLVFLGFIPGYAPRPGYGLGNFWFPAVLVLILETAAVYMLLFGGIGHPSFVAVAEDGFHMWFDSPYDRHLNDTVFPWDEIQKIYLTGGRTPHWVLRWTTGESTNLYMLNRSNLNLLVQEWTRRATHADL